MIRQTLMLIGLIDHQNSYKNPLLYIYMYCFNGVLRCLYRIWIFAPISTKTLSMPENLIACCFIKRNWMMYECSNGKGSCVGCSTVKRNLTAGMGCL